MGVGGTNAARHGDHGRRRLERDDPQPLEADDQGAARELAEREAVLGHTVVFAASGETVHGIVLGDSLKASAAEAVAELRRLGVDVRLLSGDMEATTAAVARPAAFLTTPAVPSAGAAALGAIMPMTSGKPSPCHSRSR